MVKELNPDDTTHKRVSFKNVERLLKLGIGGESFNDILTKLLDEEYNRIERRTKRKKKGE